MAITLRQIQAFLAVTEQGTFTKAAERLNMAQPALSQLVRDLERELGIRVLDRTTRRVELTDAGRDFLSRCRRLIDERDEALAAVQPDDSAPRGLLRMTCSVSAAA